MRDNQHYFELFRKFFGATFGRFYTAAQREQLLELITFTLGIERESEEFQAVLETVHQVDACKIKSLVECCNCLLLCDFGEENSDLALALWALKSVLEEKQAARQGSGGYNSPREWHYHVYASAAEDSDAKLDMAFIAYCAGRIEEATRLLSELCAKGKLLAVELLVAVYHKCGDPANTYLYLILLEKILSEKLHLEGYAWMVQLRGTLCECLEDSEQREMERMAQVKLQSGFDHGSKRAIGFCV